MPVNKSEEFVALISKKTFLSLWSYANPQGKDAGKELCDVLVVCDPHVILISVKDITLKDTGRPEVDSERWTRKAIEDSIGQLNGASRWIDGATRVIQSDGKPGLPLPPKERRIVHKIAVAIGSRGEIPIISAHGSSEFVHVLTEQSLLFVFRELDTISDFTKYLTDKEEALDRSPVMVEGTEADMVAFYLQQGRQFPSNADALFLDAGMVEHYEARPEVIAKRKEDEQSYAWDHLIEDLSAEIIDDGLQGLTLSEAEESIREMALEHRFSRRILGHALLEFLSDEVRSKIRSRIVRSQRDGVLYVFLHAFDQDRQSTVKELQVRCYVARGMNKERHTVVGIAFDWNTEISKVQMMAYWLRMPDWTQEDDELLEGMQRETGAFAKPIYTSKHFDEYPSDIE